MLRDMSPLVVDFAGKPILNDDKQPVTVREAVRDALLGNYRDENPQPDWAEKARRYELANKINLSDSDNAVELSSEDLSKIKTLVGKMFSTYIVGWLVKFLEKDPPPALMLAKK